MARMSNDRLPARTLPLLYLGSAHLSLALAFLCAAWWPRSVAGFFYHSWLVGLVHLVTLGWITFSILGSIYIVAPLALRVELPARRADYLAYALALIGLVGMVGHFWIQQFEGMAWSAVTIAGAILYMTTRIAVSAQRARIHPGIKLHLTLACVNLWIAASMGLLIAFDKFAHFLPGFVLANVFAHAHLAALGWAAMMVVGVGYRLLPMTLPSKIPAGNSIYLNAALLEIGALGLFVTLLLRSRLAIVFALTFVGGLAVFLGQVVWMLGHRVSKPVGAPRIDFGLFHAAAAGISLLTASAIGLSLLTRPESPEMLRAAAAYGVLGLVGFLAQMVVAMETTLLPMVSWFWAYAGSGYRVAPQSPRVMRDRSLQTIVFAGWTIGVPALTMGMFWESPMLVAVGAWSLLVGVSIAALDSIFVIVQAIRA
jgi:hypothetical protein